MVSWKYVRKTVASCAWREICIAAICDGLHVGHTGRPWSAAPTDIAARDAANGSETRFRKLDGHSTQLKLRIAAAIPETLDQLLQLDCLQGVLTHVLVRDRYGESEFRGY